jgi:hypothetical protein
MAVGTKPARRFPLPWRIEEGTESFIIADATGQKLAYVHYEDEPGRRNTMHRLTRDDPRYRGSAWHL